MYTEETERSQVLKCQWLLNENHAIDVAHDVVILVVRAVFILAAEVGTAVLALAMLVVLSRVLILAIGVNLHLTVRIVAVGVGLTVLTSRR